MCDFVVCEVLNLVVLYSWYTIIITQQGMGLPSYRTDITVDNTEIKNSIYFPQIRPLELVSICLIFLVLQVFRLTYYILFSVRDASESLLSSLVTMVTALSQYIITDSTLARNLFASRLKTLQVFRTSANVRG
jgi:hypothetical protein